MAFKNVEDRKQYMRDYYANKRAKYIELLGGKCVSCGSQFNLEFDHIDRNNKRFAIGKLMTYSEEIILEELKLCQILCKTCHDIKSSKESLKGSEKSNAKLTEKDVVEIRKRLKLGSTCKELSIEFNVSDVAISLIKNKKSWRHVPES